MMPQVQHDRSALRWIRGELDQTVREARIALEDFVEGQHARLQAGIDLLHHVHGALDMVQVYGGAMLADEMEQLALAMFQGQVKRPDAAAEALMLGMVQLPAYIEKIEGGGADVPLVLLPLMNDLRAAREAPLVSETSLFAPKLNTVIAAETVRPGSGNRDLPQLIHHQRNHYHKALLHWIRGQDVATALTQIRDVLDTLHSAAGTTRFRRLLDAGEALATALLDDGQAPAPAAKPLFGKLDRVFKQVMDQGEEAAMLDFPVDLLKNMLYYVARSSSQDPAVLAVKQTADLANNFPEQMHQGLAAGSLGGPDRELFQAVGDALAQDLGGVKDQLDLFMRSDRSQQARLTGLAQPIQRIGDTLGMVGRGDLRTRLKRRCEELRAVETSGEMMPDEQLMTLAGDLLFVESALAGLASGATPDSAADAAVEPSLSAGEMRQHLRAAVDEALVELARTKDTILQFLEQPEQVQQLVDVPSRLHMVAGVLQMLELPEAGRLLGDLKPYIASLASGQEQAPDARRRDALADVIVSAELYMQSAIEPGADRAQLLAFAEAALERLGLRQAQSAAPAPTAQDEPVVGTEVGGGISAQQGTIPETASDEPLEVASSIVVADTEPEAAQPLGSEGNESAAVELPVSGGGDSVDVDSEILEVFGEEAEEELQSIQERFPKWRGDPDDRESLLTMRRSFHTLKGSGRIVGASNIGEFSWAIENMLNRVIDGTVPVSADLLQLMDDVVATLPVLVAESRQPGGPASDVSALAERAFSLASGTGVTATAPSAAVQSTSPEEELPGDESLDIDEVSALSELSLQIEEDLVSDDTLELEFEADGMAVAPDDDLSADTGETPVKEDVPDETAVDATTEETGLDRFAAQGHAADESILTDAPVQDSEFLDLEANAVSSADSSLNAVFLNEAEGHLNVLAAFIGRARELGGCALEDGVRRAMHTLRGSSSAAGATEMAELAEALEHFSNLMCDAKRPLDSDMLDLLERSHQTLSALAAAVEDPHRDVDGWESLRDEVGRVTAAMARAPATTGGTGESPQTLEALDPELLEIFLEEARELLESLEGELGDWQYATSGDQMPVAKLQRTLHTMKGGARLAGVAPVGDLSHALESVFESVAESRITGSDRLKGLVRHATDALAQDIEVLMRGAMPAAHTAVIDRLETAARGREWDDVAAVEAVLTVDGEVSQLIEQPVPPEPEPDLPVDVMPEPEVETTPAGDGDAEPLPEVASTLQAAEQPALDDVAEIAESEPEADDEFGADSELLTDSQLMTDSELLGDSSFLVAGSVTASDGGPVGAVVKSDSKVVQFPGSDRHLDEEGFVPRLPFPQQEAAPTTGTERVRVSSEALDQMVNNAGEVSIYRARIEQQNNSFAFNLGELGQTIDRLRSQLRDLELETEAQILSRHEREGESRADFDPLELDRYSTIQQLSRALSETVEDLSNLGQSLGELSRDTDTLLLQQARVNTDLQDGLLRTRMVKFSSRVPRLERVVRQTSHSVGKQAALKVIGGDEDMDRAILERMMSPLEHLLRNAVSHGIEDANARLANGKAAQGLITLHLAREGSDVVLTLADDGAGLDRARIRAKAVERGLLDADAAVDDDDLYQLILQHGFSTAQELSQVSGRGVGMDVVLTEVKQLGGTLEIASQPGRGTGFTIRLPFTLAITDSLLVTLGEDIYAVPHSSMDGVVRIPVEELRAIYSGEQAVFRYGERDYNVRYLGTMLGVQAPHISEGARWLPLLLVRSGEHRVAIQVDSLLGNRQIVVKSVGAQLSTVRWFTGGTILADGQIALILDVNSLVRMDSAQQLALPTEASAPATKGVSVMVVDDSITVRKVTSRLLERHNMHVMTAKDGVDAVTLLQEQHPDVMLLDIEMPRMDGYELARHMRSTPELSDIPIIMITSRTGDKHRSRALELGVKRYLGKPYQEAELLENIYTVLADSAL
ncbi:MAG: Hpt domain-containing protein [Chromatiaceae bacterium]|nr:Hpt domain-containing protein [Gammaproteobacteria bacterium]MCP5317776.1 Hpt domain-containing protein [Chromatiaceae bacterium]MCP5434752.1 Hpt domain-containing protein [Chromatiaceae bacterium]